MGRLSGEQTPSALTVRPPPLRLPGTRLETDLTMLGPRYPLRFAALP